MKTGKTTVIQDKTLIILWLSRHDILAEQLRELRAIFGENIMVIQVRKTHKNAQDIVNLADSCHADEIVAVLPLSIMGALTHTRYKPIKAVMKAGPGDTWTHDHFERVLSVDTVSQILAPSNAHKKAATGPVVAKRDHVGGGVTPSK